MDLKGCLKAGINLSDEDTNAVLDNFDSYIDTMTEAQATVLAVNDAITSAKIERAETLAEINANPEVIASRYDQSQMEQLFVVDEDTVIADINDIRARDSESPQESIDNAMGFMDQSIAGEIPPRQPLTVWKVTGEDASTYYSLRDGNTTYQILKDHGFTEVPVSVERSVQESALPAVEEHGSTRGNIPLNELGTLTKEEVDARTAEMKADQAGWGFEETYDKATENQQYLNRVAKAISKMVDVKYKVMPPKGGSVAGEKTRDSAEIKINGKYKGDASQMTDIVRGTFTVKNPDEVKTIVKQLGKRFKGVDEGYKVNGSFYFDRKLLVQFENGQVGEIQIVAPEAFWFKEERGGHPIYKLLEKEATYVDPIDGETKPKAGWEYIAKLAVNTMKAGYANAIGSESDQAWLDIYEQTLEAQLSPEAAADAKVLAEKAADVKDSWKGLVDDHTGTPLDPNTGVYGVGSDVTAAVLQDWNADINTQATAIDPANIAGAFNSASPKLEVAPDRGMAMNAIQKVYGAWLKVYPQVGKIQLTVYKTQREAFGRDLVDDNGKPIIIQGGFYAGTNEMILIAEHISSPKTLDTILRHETIGHFGMREVLNKNGRYDRLLSRVWKARRTEMKEEAAWVDANYPDLAEAVENGGSWGDIKSYADEMIARAAETDDGKAIGLKQRIYDLIKKWLNEWGLTAGPVSQREMRSLIRTSSMKLKKELIRKYSKVPIIGGEAGAFLSRREQSEYAEALAKGMDMSQEARLARANLMGYDTSVVWYHGTSKTDAYSQEGGAEFDVFSQKTDPYWPMRPFTMATQSPHFAGLFAGVSGYNESTAEFSRVIPLYAKIKKTFNYSKLNAPRVNYGFDESAVLRKELLSYLEAETIKRNLETRATDNPIYFNSKEAAIKAAKETALKNVEQIADGSWTIIESKVFQNWLHKKGYDSFYVMEGGQKNLGVLNPNQLRSINAAFDPANRDSDKLLARRGTGEEGDIEIGSTMDTYRREQQKRPIVGQVMEPIRNKSGEYRRNGAGDITGAPRGVKTQEQVDAIIQKIVAYMESPAAQMPESAEWYNISGAAIREISHGDPVLTEKVVRIAAVLSAANQVGGNTTGFIKAAHQLANGEEVAAGRFPNEIKKAMPAILAAKDMNFHLPKVEAKVMSFYRNLWDATFQSDKYEGSVTMDMWMARLYEYKGDTFGQAQYRFASMLTKNAAESYNTKHGTTLTPDQVQAALWVYARNTESGVTPSGERSGFDTYIERAKQHITVEAVPSKKSGLFPEIHSMSFKMRQDYTSQAMKVILDENGENELFNRLGIPLYSDAFSEGTFEGDVNPNAVLDIVSRKVPVEGKKGTTLPSYEEANLASKALQYIYTQDMVPWFQLDHTLTGSTRGIAVNFSEKPNTETEEAFLAHLGGVHHINTDFTRVGDSFFLLNYTDLSNKAFIQRVEDAIHDYREIGGVGWEQITGIETDVKAKGSEDYSAITTDWSDEAAALAEIEEYFSDAGQSDLFGWLHDRRQEVGKLQERFAQDVAPPLDANDPNFRFRKVAQDAQDAPVGQSFGMPEEGWKDRFTRFIRDNFNRWLTTQDEIKKHGGTVSYDSDVYEHEIRSSGIKVSRLKAIERSYMKPLLVVMKKAKMTMEVLDLFLVARHAEERNNYIAGINPDMQDGGSGMTTDEADSILAELADQRPALEEAADIIYALNNERLDNSVDAGHLTQETVDGWRARWNYYVPLKGKAGEPVQQTGGGAGFSGVGSGIQKAMGRGTGNMPESPTAHAFADASATVIRAENTKVGQSLVSLVMENPNPNLWGITKRTYEQFEDMFGTAFEGWTEEPTVLVEGSDYHRVHSTTAAERAAAKAEGRKPVPSVHYAIDPNYRNRDDVFTVMVNGEELTITIKDTVAMAQMKKLSNTQMNGLVRGMATVNRYLAMVSTALNPEFVITNFERDFQTAMVHLGGEHTAAIAARVAKGIPSAVRGIWQSSFDTKGKSEWRTLFEEMEAEGGTIGFFGLEDIDTKVKNMKQKLDTQSGPIKSPMKAIRALREVVLDANMTIENAARLSAYKVMKEENLKSGMSMKEAKGKAAVTAKELTVNFNRKGELGPVLNSLYLFYNATIQGTFRMLGSIAKNPRTQKIVGGIAATSFALALFNRGAGGDDEDGIPYWDKYSDYTKQTHLIILDPTAQDGSALVKIRLPYGYNVFHYTGVVMDSLMFNEHTSVMAESLKMLAAAGNAFNPIQGSNLIDTIMPTIAKPFTQHQTNENFMGGPVKPEFPFDNYDRPESEKYFKSTNSTLRDMMIAMNTATGGDSTHSGIIDMSPEVLKHYIKWLTGGMGATAMRAAGTATNIITGEPNETRNVPFLRQFAGQPSSRFDTGRFYDAVREVNAVEAGLKQRLGTNEWSDYQQEHSEVHKLSMRMKGTKKRIKFLREERDRAYAAEDTDKADVVREQMRQVMMEFSSLFDDAIEGDNE